MRNDVPGGAEGLLVPPAGVARAGGKPGTVLIEQLRASVRALEQVPVSLGLPPAPGTGPSRPACSLSSSPSDLFNSPSEGEGCDGQGPPPDRGLVVTLREDSDPLPDFPAFREMAFPLDRLWQAGLHEIKPASYHDVPAALAFALAALAQGDGKPGHGDLVLWCLTQRVAREWGRPYGPGLIAQGLDPACFLIVETRTAQDAAWALEEGLKSRTLIAALGQAEIREELASRRLGLAAQASRTPCLLLSGHTQASRRTGLLGTLTRWCIAARRSGLAPFDTAAPGAPAWHVTLERCRGEAPGRSFIVEFSHESDGFHLSATSSAGEAEAKRQSFAG